MAGTPPPTGGRPSAQRLMMVTVPVLVVLAVVILVLVRLTGGTGGANSQATPGGNLQSQGAAQPQPGGGASP